MQQNTRKRKNKPQKNTSEKKVARESTSEEKECPFEITLDRQFYVLLMFGKGKGKVPEIKVTLRLKDPSIDLKDLWLSVCFEMGNKSLNSYLPGDGWREVGKQPNTYVKCVPFGYESCEGSETFELSVHNMRTGEIYKTGRSGTFSVVTEFSMLIYEASRYLPAKSLRDEFYMRYKVNEFEQLCKKRGYASAMHYAAQKYDYGEKLIPILLQCNKPVDQKNDDGETPRDIAEREEKTNVLNLIDAVLAHQEKNKDFSFSMSRDPLEDLLLK